MSSFDSSFINIKIKMDPLFSNNNKIVHCEVEQLTGRPTLRLDLANIERMTNPYLEQNTKNVSVGVVTVLGSSSDDFSRRLCTDWLIHTHENTEAVVHLPDLNTTAFEKLHYARNSNSSKDCCFQGIYMWPKPLTTTINSDLFGGEHKLLIWVMFATSSSTILSSFAALASSKIGVLQTKLTETLLDYLKVMKGNFAIKYAEVQKYPSNLMESVSLTQSAIRFLERNKTKPVPPLMNLKQEIVTLGTFTEYLEQLIEKLNESSTFLVLEPNSEQSNDFKQAEIKSKLKSTIAKPIIPTKISHQQKKSDPTQLRLQNYGGDDSKKEMQSQLMHWIHSNIISEGCIDNVMLEFQNAPTEFKTQLKEVVDAVKIFQGQILNMFDNYLCFDGETDLAQMHRFHNNAYCNVVDNFKQKYFNHTSWQIDALKQLCAKIYKEIEKENYEIIENEKTVANKIINVMIPVYKNKICDYLRGFNVCNQPNELEQSLYEFHDRIKDCILTIFEDCMDSLGKINNVAEIYSDKLNHYIFNSFKEVRQEFCTSPKQSTNPFKN